MKKYTSFLLLICFMLGFSSCLFQEDNLFDQPAAQRANADVEKYQKLLTSAKNGYQLRLTVGDNQSMGAYTLLCKFDGRKVTMMSELGTTPTDDSQMHTSLYRVINETATLLTFDTYNPLMHMFSEPLGTNSSYGGDYEFIITGTDADGSILLTGKTYKNKMRLTPLPKDFKWNTYLDQLKQIRFESEYYSYSLMNGDKELASMLRSGMKFITYKNFSLMNSGNYPLYFTNEGIHLLHPIRWNGLELSDFKWDATAEAFSCTQQGAESIKIVCRRPAFYLNYEDFLGDYTLKLQEISVSNGEIVKKDIEVEAKLVEKEKGKSYMLESTYIDENAVPLEVSYDHIQGRLLIPVPQFGQIGNYHIAVALASAEGYIISYHLGFYPSNDYSITDSKIGLRGQIDENQSGVHMQFVEEGGLLTSLVGVPATGLVFGAYSSSELTKANYLGYYTWIDNIQLIKK